METVALLQKLQRDMHEYFDSYIGSDARQQVQHETELVALSNRLTVVYVAMLNDINDLAHTRHLPQNIDESDPTRELNLKNDKPGSVLTLHFDHTSRDTRADVSFLLGQLLQISRCNNTSL